MCCCINSGTLERSENRRDRSTTGAGAGLRIGRHAILTELVRPTRRKILVAVRSSSWTAKTETELSRLSSFCYIWEASGRTIAHLVSLRYLFEESPGSSGQAAR